MMRVHAKPRQHRLQLLVQPLRRLLIVRRIAECDGALRIYGHPIFRAAGGPRWRARSRRRAGPRRRGTTWGRAWSRAASRRDTAERPTCPSSGCCPSGTRTHPRQSDRSRSSRVSSGKQYRSARSRQPARHDCCGTCSCGQPDPTHWQGRWDACRSPTSAAVSPSWRRRTRPPQRRRDSTSRVAVVLDHHLSHLAARRRSCSASRLARWSATSHWGTRAPDARTSPSAARRPLPSGMG